MCSIDLAATARAKSPVSCCPLIGALSISTQLNRAASSRERLGRSDRCGAGRRSSAVWSPVGGWAHIGLAPATSISPSSSRRARQRQNAPASSSGAPLHPAAPPLIARWAGRGRRRRRARRRSLRSACESAPRAESAGDVEGRAVACRSASARRREKASAWREPTEPARAAAATPIAPRKSHPRKRRPWRGCSRRTRWTPCDRVARARRRPGSRRRASLARVEADGLGASRRRRAGSSCARRLGARLAAGSPEPPTRALLARPSWAAGDVVPVDPPRPSPASGWGPSSRAPNSRLRRAVNESGELSPT